LRNKPIPMSEYVVSQDINVFTLTEKWLGIDTDQFTINELVPAGVISLIIFLVKWQTQLWHIPQIETGCPVVYAF